MNNLEGYGDIIYANTQTLIPLPYIHMRVEIELSDDEQENVADLFETYDLWAARMGFE